MSFIHQYRPFLIILLAATIFPLTLNQRTRKLQSSFAPFIYSSIAHFLFFLITIIVFTLRVQTNPIQLGTITGLSNALQGVFSCSVHFMVISLCVITRHEHGQFLNDIIRLDERFTKLLPTRRLLLAETRTLVETIGFSFLFLVLSLYVDGMVYDLKPLWHNRLYTNISSEAMTIRCLLTMHLRYCVLLLQRRFAIACEHLMEEESLPVSTHHHQLLQMIENIFTLIRNFEHIFRHINALNVLSDLMQLAITVYMIVLFVTKEKDYTSIVRVMTTFAMLATKQAIFILAIHQIGTMVSGKMHLLYN